MEGLILLVIGVPIALAIWLIARAISAQNRIEELSRRVGYLEAQLHGAKEEPAPALASKPEAVPQRTAVPPQPAPIIAPAALVPAPEIRTPPPRMTPIRETLAVPLGPPVIPPQ